MPRLTQAGHHEAMPVLLDVLEAEAEARRQRRIARLRRSSRLPPGKTFATLDTGRLPGQVVQQLETPDHRGVPRDGDERAGVRPDGRGVGKSHALSAVGHALVEAGHSVLCAPAYALVKELLGGKRDLDLSRALRKLDLPRDQMATAAALDRLVHHAVVIEFDVPSYGTDRSRRKSPSALAPKAGLPVRCCPRARRRSTPLNARMVREPSSLWIAPAVWKTRLTFVSVNSIIVS